MLGLALGALELVGAVSTGFAWGSIFLPISCKSLPTPVMVFEQATRLVAMKREMIKGLVFIVLYCRKD